MAHARLSPSGADKWMTCTQAPTMEVGYPDTTSEFAAEGTLAHALLEVSLLRRSPPCKADLGQNFGIAEQYGVTSGPIAELVVDNEMLEFISQSYDHVMKYVAEGYELFVEQRVDYSQWVPGGFGTSDVILVHPELKRMIVRDLKYGKGVEVHAEDNPQLQLYALGAYDGLGTVYEIDEIEVQVDQPRIHHFDNWSFSTTALLAFGDKARQAAWEVDNDPKFNPSEKACKWCKAKATCPALAERVKQAVAGDFENLEMPIVCQPNQLTLEEQAQLLTLVPLVRGWANALEEICTAEALQGKPIPGYKLVRGRKSRSWADEEKAEAELRKKHKVAEIFTKKLITVAQAEKLRGKQHPLPDDLVAVKEGNLTLVPESDKRKAVSVSVADDFENLENENS